MEEKFSFRKFKMEDLDDYKTLFSIVYSTTIEDDFFCWKNLKNPDRDNEALIYLVLNEKGKIVGANSFFPAKLTFQNREFLIVQSGDTMVSSEYRRRGLWKELLKYAMKDLKEKGYGAILGIPISNSLPGLKSMGFEVLYEMNRFIKVLNFKNVLTSKLQNVPGIRLLGRAVDFFYGLLSFRKCDHLYDIQKYDLSDTSAFYDGVTSEVEQYIVNITPDRIRSIKDKSYLRWKYNEKPNSKYEMIIVRDGHAIIAVLVVRVEEHLGNKSCKVVEYFVDKSDDLDVAMKYVLNDYKKSKFSYLSIWDFGDEIVKRAYRRNLFFKQDLDLYFTVKLLDDDLRFLYDLGLWHIVEGDADTA